MRCPSRAVRSSTSCSTPPTAAPPRSPSRPIRIQPPRRSRPARGAESTERSQMSTATASPPAVATQPSGFGAKRVLLLVFGSIVLLIALSLLAGGGAALWGLGKRDSSGYITSASHRLSTPSYALTSDSLDVGTDAPNWLFGDHFGTVRIEGTSSQPVFIGIARTPAVERY